MSTEEVLIGKTSGILEGIILKLAELLQDNLFFCLKLLLGDLEMKEDFLLIA